MKTRVGRMTVLVMTALMTALPPFAQSPQQLADDATRYMAMGDSVAAAYK
jgi:hypothetical protein